MHKVFRFFHLPLNEKIIVLQAISLLLSYRMRLKVQPFHKPIHSVRRRSRHNLAHAKQTDLTPVRITRLVRVAHRCIPFSTCLSQAMAGKVVLSQYGYDAQLHIGVRNDEPSGFAAHAWLSYHGEVLIGELPNLDGFQELHAFSRKEMQ